MSALPAVPNGSAENMTVLAQQWAKRYVRNLAAAPLFEEAKPSVQPDDPKIIVDKLLANLRNASAQSWQRTEKFLGDEVKRHGIDPDLIDPWEISKDVHDLYKKSLNLYAEGLAPNRLSVKISADVGKVRSKFAAVDPRVIGFVSMQFHSSGELLLQHLSEVNQVPIRAYFKVIDDHLYMPLHRAYDAAASHAYDSPALALVQHLLPHSTAIAQSVCDRVIELFPNYRCHSGPLSKPIIRISSIRDVEMFQIYLWVCLLEGSLEALQEELFPLCVMIYPTLNVGWELVQQMIHLLGKEIQARTQGMDTAPLVPYFLALREMFSPRVFE